ncbi:DUF4126 domain-containing protein [Leucobacter salsicius]|uniref:DUF4126 domain-containing protein n=1 Tax=Leucobacter salsicius TaxID=664638 RepID=UPI00034C751C|nr:DUF4126 domain-containing protein [Leucobacter salsicius]
MLELITGTVLAASAGLNAYIPLLGLGLMARFTSLVDLPDGWSWLANEWSLGIVAVLLVIEIIVDKVPALDTVNDVVQTAIRPAAGGLAFSAGSASETVAVSDPAAFITSAQVWPFALGILVALVPHLLKAIARPALNLVTAGAGAAAVSTLEDIGAVALTVLAVVVPVLALIALVAAIVWLARRLRRALAERRARRTRIA